MLPGFRFLFTAIMLSMSLLVFGLGAASLLRAAHQVFAGNPSWLGAPEMTFAHRGETNALVLAALRVDPPTIEKTASEPADVITSPSVEPGQRAPADPAAAQIAALNPSDAPPMVITKPDSAEVPAGNPPAAEAAARAPVPFDETRASPAGETKTAALADLNSPPDKNEATIAEPNPANSAQPDPVKTTSPAVTPEASDAETKIATLGGAPVDISASLKEPATKPEQAKADQKADQSVIKKRARRAAYRRRLAAARARFAAQQLLLLQQANPFALALQAQPPVPAPVPLPAKRQRSR